MEELMRRAVRALEAAGDMDAAADARWLMCAALDCAPGALRFHAAPDAQQRGRFLAMLERRAAGEPLQYVLGDQPFCGRSFRADPRALIPRPETEEVCLKALELLRGVRRPEVLDMGTGTGVLAVTIALERPDARVTAVDISPDALALAGENARALHEQVGRSAVRAGAELVLTAGELSKDTCRGAEAEGGRAKWYSTRDELICALPEMISEGDAVLVKASHSMAFERITEALQTL